MANKNKVREIKVRLEEIIDSNVIRDYCNPVSKDYGSQQQIHSRRGPYEGVSPSKKYQITIVSNNSPGRGDLYDY